MNTDTFPLKRWQKGKVYTRYTDIRKELDKMQKTGGAVWLPISLVNIIYKFLIDKGEKGNTQEKARNSAYVFSCLCNEFYIQCITWKLRDEFFVHSERWEEYMIGRSAKKTGIRILKEIGLIIDHGQRTLLKGKKPFRPPLGNPPFKPTIYEINLEVLRKLQPQAQSFTSETWEKEQERKFNTVPTKKDMDGLEQLLKEL